MPWRRFENVRREFKSEWLCAGVTPLSYGEISRVRYDLAERMLVANDSIVSTSGSLEELAESEFLEEPVRRPDPRGTGLFFWGSPPDFCLLRPWSDASLRSPSGPFFDLLFAMANDLECVMPVRFSQHDNVRL